MEPSQDRCRQEGCNHPRTQYSVFCEEHHREQLVRVGLERETPPDPCEGMAGRCRKFIRAFDAGAITPDEMFSSLFDLLVHAGMQGLERCWGSCLDALTPDAAVGLRTYVEAHPEPRLFHPLPIPDTARHEAERVALGVQARLLQSLGMWVPPGEKHGAAGADWHRAHRREVEAFFTDDRLVAGSEQVHTSPSGKYRLEVRDYASAAGGWDYSRGLAYAGDRLVADVKRNYGIFHFGWAEGHPDGHDYLLCGEDYQAQTVVQLDTGRRADYVPEQAKSGHGFCCAAYYPSPDRRLVVIDGCYWACPYELVFCRFDDPMSLPWPQIDRVDLSGEPQGWTGEGFVYESAEDVRAADGIAFNDLPETEQDELMKRWQEAGGQRVRRWLRASDGSKTLTSERVVPNAPKPGG